MSASSFLDGSSTLHSPTGTRITTLTARQYRIDLPWADVVLRHTPSGTTIPVAELPLPQHVPASANNERHLDTTTGHEGQLFYGGAYDAPYRWDDTTGDRGASTSTVRIDVWAQQAPETESGANVIVRATYPDGFRAAYTTWDYGQLGNLHDTPDTFWSKWSRSGHGFAPGFRPNNDYLTEYGLGDGAHVWRKLLCDPDLWENEPTPDDMIIDSGTQAAQRANSIIRLGPYGILSDEFATLPTIRSWLAGGNKKPLLDALHAGWDFTDTDQWPWLAWCAAVGLYLNNGWSTFKRLYDQGRSLKACEQIAIEWGMITRHGETHEALHADLVARFTDWVSTVGTVETANLALAAHIGLNEARRWASAGSFPSDEDLRTLIALRRQ